MPTHELPSDPSTLRHYASLKFSSSTRRLPLLSFWLFLSLTVIIAGILAHDRSDWQSFWNREAVVAVGGRRTAVLLRMPFGIALDSLATAVNRIFVKGGWIVAAIIIILVQSFYIALVLAKRHRAPALQFIRHYNLRWMIAIEAAVLVASTFYFMVCTWSFNEIAKTVGSCQFSDGSFSFPINRSACPSPAVFRGFDISGHCFLIVHSCLLALEYVAKVLFVWRTRDSSSSSLTLFNDKDSDLESVRSENEEIEPKSNNFFNRNHSIYRVTLVILLTLVFLLCTLEFLVFLQTILFYHTVLEKILGTVIGASFWIGLFLLSLKYPHLF